MRSVAFDEIVCVVGGMLGVSANQYFWQRCLIKTEVHSLPAAMRQCCGREEGECLFLIY